MSRSVRLVSLCAVALLTGVLVGCSDKNDSHKSASQVAVKVNKEEVSVHQLNDLLARGGNIPQEQLKNASAQALERLIEQELMVQQARERKLDREPRVVQALESAHRDILARFYGEQVASAAARPTSAQIDTFYNDNPPLFAKRRIYALQEISIQIPPERLEEVTQRLKSGATIQQVKDWLTEQKIQFQVSGGIKPAEQIPPEVLKGISQLNPGQAFVGRTPVGLTLLLIEGARDEPVDRTKARPAIENFLLTKARSELVKAEIKRLREIAAIEYVGDFVPEAKDAAAAPAPAEPAQTPAEPAADAPGNAIRSAIEQGAVKLK
jgi:EpsD family peptidyl-prolyl cis-trans isomerase